MINRLPWRDIDLGNELAQAHRFLGRGGRHARPHRTVYGSSKVRTLQQLSDLMTFWLERRAIWWNA